MRVLLPDNGDIFQDKHRVNQCQLLFSGHLKIPHPKRVTKNLHMEPKMNHFLNKNILEK